MGLPGVKGKAYSYTVCSYLSAIMYLPNTMSEFIL